MFLHFSNDYGFSPRTHPVKGKTERSKNWTFRHTSLCSSDMNEPDKSRSTCSMSSKDTFPLPSVSYTLKITDDEARKKINIKQEVNEN